MSFLPETNAQNVLPNAGFEAPTSSSFRSWEQPHGEYRHYTHDSIFAANGEYYNGICMYSSRPNEYFMVPFKEKLQAGKTYHLSMNVRAWEQKCDQFGELKKLGFRFDTITRNVSTPFFCFLEPDLELTLNVATSGIWYEIKGTYTAKGNEKYLMIGNFFEPAESQVDPEQAKKEMASSSKEKKKSKKKKEKGYADFRKMLEQERAASLPKNDTGAYFMVRYYFDDICLAPMAEDGSFTCNSGSETPKAGDVFVGRNIHFETDKATLLESSFSELDEWVEFLRDNSQLRIQVNGHTDDTGNSDHNLTLSLARAQTVRVYLIENGIEAERVECEGFGSSKPVSNTNSESSRALDRRVEFEVLAH